MANIARVRTFNGTSDRIELTEGALDAGMAGFTWAAIVKNNAPSGASGTYRQIVSLRGSASGEWSFGVGNNTGAPAALDQLAAYVVVSGGTAGSTAESSAGYLTSAMGWCLVAVTKSSGIATPRWHRYRFDTQTWDHTNDNETHGDPDSSATTAELYIGAYDPTGEFFDGQIAVVGIWGGTALSDAQLETMTRGVHGWQLLAPSSLFLLNQEGSSVGVGDLAGTCDHTATTGTAVQTPVGLTFDVGYPGEIQRDAPRGWWRMHDASGSPKDSSGYANPVTVVTGTPTYRSAGPLGGQQTFSIAIDDGDYFTIPDDPTLDLGDVVTIECWVKRTRSGAIEEALLAKCDANTGAYGLYYLNNNLMFAKSGVAALVQSTVSVTDTGWHHVVGTKNGASIKLYIDGVDRTGTVTNLTLADTIATVGIGHENGLSRLAGSISEIAVYPTSLSAERVLAHYEAGVGEPMVEGSTPSRRRHTSW